MVRCASLLLAGAAALAAAVLPIAALAQVGTGPNAMNPSAAPSNIGNSSSINPSAAASDIRNPSAINPSAGASDLRQLNSPGVNRTPATAESRPSLRKVETRRPREARRRTLRRPTRPPSRMKRTRRVSPAAVARQRRSDTRGTRIMGSVCQGC